MKVYVCVATHHNVKVTTESIHPDVIDKVVAFYTSKSEYVVIRFVKIIDEEKFVL